MKTQSRLNAETVRVSQLSDSDRERMYQILDRYYAFVSWEIFLKDLSEKSEVILLKSEHDQKIQGFSTLKFFETEVEGRLVKAVFSGDTIVEQEFWGQTALQKAFVSRLFQEKLKSPHRPLYWYLISKGYKTYLLMANNFQRYYPSSDGSQALQAHADAFSRHLFGSAYDARMGLLQFGAHAPRLKGEVAPIPSDLLESHPKIAYFAQKNPTWQQGTELACVAELNLPMVMGFTVKTLRKTFGLRTQIKTPQAARPCSAEQPHTA